MAKLAIEKLSLKYVERVAEIESKLIGQTDSKKIQATIENDNLNYYVLLEDDEVIGFFEALIISPEAELYDIAIDEKWQGRGYSKILLNYFFDLCLESKCETIFLEVNSINSKAINLYLSVDFEKYSIRKNYYGKSDAVLMKKNLN